MNWQKYTNSENSINGLPKVHRWRCSSIFSVSCLTVETKSIAWDHWEGMFDLGIISQTTLVLLAANRWPEKALWREHCRCLQNETVCLWEAISCPVKKQILTAEHFVLVWCLVLLGAPCCSWWAALICIHPIFMCPFSYRVIALFIENKSCRKCLCGYT